MTIKRLLVSIFLIIVGFSSIHAQNYSGLWSARDSKDEESLNCEVFIQLNRQSNGSYFCEFYNNGDEYVFSSSKPYSIKGKDYDVCELYLIKKNGKQVSSEKRNGCELYLYHNIQKVNLISFVNRTNPYVSSSILQFYNSEIATQNAIAEARNYERSNEINKTYSSFSNTVTLTPQRFHVCVNKTGTVTFTAGYGIVTLEEIAKEEGLQHISGTTYRAAVIYEAVFDKDNGYFLDPKGKIFNCTDRKIRISCNFYSGANLIVSNIIEVNPRTFMRITGPGTGTQIKFCDKIVLSEQ